MRTTHRTRTQVDTTRREHVHIRRTRKYARHIFQPPSCLHECTEVGTYTTSLTVDLLTCTYAAKSTIIDEETRKNGMQQDQKKREARTTESSCILCVNDRHNCLSEVGWPIGARANQWALRRQLPKCHRLRVSRRLHIRLQVGRRRFHHWRLRSSLLLLRRPPPSLLTCASFGQVGFAIAGQLAAALQDGTADHESDHQGEQIRDRHLMDHGSTLL